MAGYEISSSPNPVGSGARALGMGGAFIGVADDATASSWNPAGLIQLETPELSIVGAYNCRTADITYQSFPESSGPQGVSSTDINYLSAAYPFVFLNRNMIFSFAYQYLYDFNKKLELHTAERIPPPPRIPPIYEQNDNFRYEMHGALKALSPAVAIRICDDLSLGVTVNFWDNGLYSNKWTMEGHLSSSGSITGIDFESRQDIKDTFGMSGLNVNLGLLWKLNHILSLGMIVKTPFTAAIEHDNNYYWSIVYPTEPDSNQTISENNSYHETLDMPMSYGAGMALRFGDVLTLALDVYHTRWDGYVLHTADGLDVSPVTGKSSSESEVGNTTQIRLGGEYLLVGERTVIPVRLGLFYDPEPWEGGTQDFWGIGIGTGIGYKNFVYDLAYQYRFGRDIHMVAWGNEASQDIDQHTLYMSVIYHF